MKNFISATGFCTAIFVLAGCTSGTTYGTGTSHEQQTLKGLYNIMSIRADENTNIDYSARPDLVMPSNNQALPAPADANANNQQNWPVSPEERIQAARAAAPEADWRSGDLPTEYLTSEKEGIQNSAGLYRASRANVRSGGDQLIDAIRDDANGVGESVEARKRREELAYSTGIKRKFLTEPPVEYRTPSATAEAGDLGITKEEVDERQKRLERERIDASNGVLTPGS